MSEDESGIPDRRTAIEELRDDIRVRLTTDMKRTYLKYGVVHENIIVADLVDDAMHAIELLLSRLESVSRDAASATARALEAERQVHDLQIARNVRDREDHLG